MKDKGSSENLEVWKLHLALNQIIIISGDYKLTL